LAQLVKGEEDARADRHCLEIREDVAPTIIEQEPDSAEIRCSIAQLAAPRTETEEVWSWHRNMPVAVASINPKAQEEST
jgi:hypothetical protein